MELVKVCPQSDFCSQYSSYPPDQSGHYPSCSLDCHFYERFIERLRFTSDERGRIKANLRKYDDAKVERFIKGLEIICVEETKIDRTERREDLLLDRQDFIKKTKSYIGALKKASRGKGLFLPNEKIDMTLSGSIENRLSFAFNSEKSEHFSDLLEKTWSAYHAVSDLLERLESIPLGKKTCNGRKHADNDNFVYLIAELYESVFGKAPSKSKTGTFRNLVEIALEAVGLPHKDPTRRLDRLKRTD